MSRVMNDGVAKYVIVRNASLEITRVRHQDCANGASRMAKVTCVEKEYVGAVNNVLPLSDSSYYERQLHRRCNHH